MTHNAPKKIRTCSPRKFARCRSGPADAAVPNAADQLPARSAATPQPRRKRPRPRRLRRGRSSPPRWPRQRSPRRAGPTRRAGRTPAAGPGVSAPRPRSAPGDAPRLRRGVVTSPAPRRCRGPYRPTRAATRMPTRPAPRPESRAPRGPRRRSVGTSRPSEGWHRRSQKSPVRWPGQRVELVRPHHRPTTRLGGPDRLIGRGFCRNEPGRARSAAARGTHHGLSPARDLFRPRTSVPPFGHPDPE